MIRILFIFHTFYSQTEVKERKKLTEKKDNKFIDKSSIVDLEKEHIIGSKSQGRKLAFFIKTKVQELVIDLGFIRLEFS